MSKNTVTIHCKPYVAHYLRLKYGIRNSNVIDLKAKSNIRKMFLNCLSKNFTASDHQPRATLTDTVQIFLNDDLALQHGKELGLAFCAALNGIFEEKIKNEAFYIINLIRLKHNMKPKEAILEFQSIYDFADTFSFAAIKADYYRSLQEAEEIYLQKRTATKPQRHANGNN